MTSYNDFYVDSTADYASTGKNQEIDEYYEQEFQENKFGERSDLALLEETGLAFLNNASFQFNQGITSYLIGA